jgi:hypothetical protein
MMPFKLLGIMLPVQMRMLEIILVMILVLLLLTGMRLFLVISFNSRNGSIAYEYDFGFTAAHGDSETGADGNYDASSASGNVVPSTDLNNLF